MWACPGGPGYPLVFLSVSWAVTMYLVALVLLKARKIKLNFVFYNICSRR